MSELCEKHRVARAAAGIVFIAVALALAGCGPTQPAPTPTAIPTAVIPRQPTYVVERGEIERKVEFLGRVQAVEDQALAFEVDGRVGKVNTSVGSTVRQGDVIAELDTSDLKNQIEQAKIELVTAQIVLSRTLSNFTETLQAAQLDLDVAQLRLTRAQQRNFGPSIDLARAEIARAERALADANTGLTSARNTPADRDMIPGFEKMVMDAEIALSRARAEYDRVLQDQSAHGLDIDILAKDVDRARLARDRVRTSIDPNLERSVEVNRLTLERLEAQLARAQILAPFDGEVSSQNMGIGKAVRAFDPVVIISKPGGLEAAAELSQARLVEIAVGQPVSVTLNNLPGQVFNGVVRRLPQVGAASTAASDRSVRVAIDGAGDVLQAGDLARITIVTARKPDALWLPPQAIRSFQGRRFVVVRDAEGERRVDVKLGLQSDDRVEILSGVLEGQTVVAP